MVARVFLREQFCFRKNWHSEYPSSLGESSESQDTRDGKNNDNISGI